MSNVSGLTPKRLFAMVLCACGGNALAAGFQLQEQNASGLGNAFAGSAATAVDASTVFFNPAGLARLSSPQLVVAGSLIAPSIKFFDRGSTSAFRTGPPLPVSFQPLGSDSGDAGRNAFLPALYLSTPIRSTDWSVGLGIGAPFGLTTQYEDGWAGRYIALRSELVTYQINLTTAYRVDETLSVGLGVSYLRADAELTNAVNFGPFGDGVARVRGDDATWGYNAGVLWQPRPGTRIGADYRSGYKLQLAGDVTTAFPGTAAQFSLLSPAQQGAFAAANGNARADLRLPEIATLSLVQQLAPRWEILADVAWTRWSVFQSLQVARDDGSILSTTPENWRNTWRIALGVNFDLDSRWRLRGGVAFDQSPVREADRTPRVPDSDRYWLAVGAQYRFTKALAIDAGYAHIFVRNARIDDTPVDAAGNAVATGGKLVGEYRSYIDIVGIQFRYAL